MKKILFFLLAMCSIHISQAHDFYAVSSGKTIYYNITDPTDHYVMVVAPRLYSGYAPYDGFDRPTGNLVIPSTVTHEGITYTVTGIDYIAFKDCTGLTSVTIPESVVYIDDYAFANCSSLSTVNTPYNPTSLTTIGEYAFQNCSALTGVSIPYSVTSIGNHAFENCTSLRNLEIVIPGMLTTIGEYAFSNCGISGSLTLTSALTYIGKHAFADCAGITSVTLSNNITTIREGTFARCSSLQSITFPSSLSTIWDYAFRECHSLHTLTFPSSLTSIGNSAFYFCSNLVNVTFPNSLTAIRTGAFSYCISIQSLSIPNSVSNLGEAAFSGCDNLRSISLPSSLTSIQKETFRSCYNLTSLVIPNSVQSIGKDAFSNCHNLTSITIPNSVTSIGDRAFCECNSLSNLTIPNSVTSIGYYSFGYCTSLTNLTIPNSVEHIGHGAFSFCSNLAYVVFIGARIMDLGSYIFNGCANPSNVLTIYECHAEHALQRKIMEDNGLNSESNAHFCRWIFPASKNTIYQIPERYSSVDSEDRASSHIPFSSIPPNFIYSDDGGTTWKAKEIILTDSQEKFEAPETFTATSASYTREFTNGNRSTLYLPFSASVPEDLEVYDFSSFANNTLSFTEHSGNLDAYTPYLVGYDISTKDGSTTTCTISATNVTFPKSEDNNYHPVTSNGMTFQGVIKRTMMSSTSNYGYSNGYFVQSGGWATVNPFRCYFSYSNPPASVPPMLDVEIVDGEVGIEEAETIDTPSAHFYSTDVYDMKGRIVRRNATSLNGLPKGVYIWKGQKVVHINY